MSGYSPVLSMIVPGELPSPLISGIDNAAGTGTGPEGHIAPAEVIAIYGSGLGPSVPAVAAPDPSGFYATTLAGVQIAIGGIAAPLLYVSDTQINAVAPFALATTGATALQIVQDGVAAPAFRAVELPGIFSIFGDEARNQDGTLNTKTNRAVSGSVVSVWTTGIPPASGIDGRVATGIAATCGYSAQVVGVAAVEAPVLYCGDAPGAVFGVTQVNVKIPDGSFSSLTQGLVTLTLYAGSLVVSASLWVAP